MAKKRNYQDWSKEELIKEIDALRKQKTYGLVWEQDKTKEVFDYYINWEGVKNKEQFKEAEGKFPVLKEVKGKEIVTDKDDNYNLLIEGDNYHSLAVLNFTHNKAIDVIYIDPPYNTGNKDFKYNDQWVDIEDGYRHSKWLSFMEKRLKLAKNLLKDEGIIFVSIDDNEQAQLRILCNEIFGEENFVSQIIWRKKYGGGAKTKYFVDTHEYILCYAKNKSNISNVQTQYREDSLKYYKYKDENYSKRGPYRLQPLATNSMDERPNLRYPILFEGHKIMPEKQWQWSKERVTEAMKKKEIVITKSKINGNYSVNFKQYLKDEEGNDRKSKPFSIIDNIYTQHGTIEIKNIFGDGQSFQFPKPTSLIKELTKIQFFKKENKDIIVLDFFAGSGTTGQAILDLNKSDGGNRKFILCTNDEGNICSEVCYPRLSRVIQGFKDSNKKTNAGLGGNLKYFKTDFVDSAPTDHNKKKIVEKSTEMICIKENAFESVKEKKGYNIFKNKEIYLGIIFDEDYIDAFIEDAKKIKGKFNVYVFSLDDTVPDKEFKELKGRVKLCPIPEAILHVYRRVFKDDRA